MKYIFAHSLRTPHKLFIAVRLALLLGVAALTNLPAQTVVEASSDSQSVVAESAATQSSIPSRRRTDIFISLADTVGQSAAAKRLVEYTQQNDPSTAGRYWAIVDFSKPSTSKRLYVFDTATGRVDTYYVAHGRGSEGANDDGIADKFSNAPHSNSSSLGIYRALNEYVGNHGRSMRLEGLEQTNNNALSRAVVMHKADYVSENFIRSTGRLGRSEGCFAVEPSVINSLVDELKNGAYIIAWKGQSERDHGVLNWSGSSEGNMRRYDLSSSSL